MPNKSRYYRIYQTTSLHKLVSPLPTEQTKLMIWAILYPQPDWILANFMVGRASTCLLIIRSPTPKDAGCSESLAGAYPLASHSGWWPLFFPLWSIATKLIWGCGPHRGLSSNNNEPLDVYFAPNLRQGT